MSLQFRALIQLPSRIFYGWWIALSCAAIIGAAAGVSFWSFGVLILPLEKEFGWPRGEIAGAFSISWMVGGLLSPFVGRAVDHFGARPMILMGTAATGASFLLLTTTQTLWQFYALHVFMVFCRSWMFFIPLSALITRWFVRRRSLALAIFTCGFPVSGVVFVPVLTFLANSFGWRETYIFCGLALWIIVLPLALWVLSSRPQDRGLMPDGDPQVLPVASSQESHHLSAESQPVHQWTVREALGTRAFWLIAVGFGLTFLAQISFSVHSIPFFVSRGIPPEAAAGLVSASNALVVLLRIPYGSLVDRIPDTRRLALLALSTQFASFSVVLFSVESPALWAFVLFQGLTGSGMPLIESSFVFRTFGDRHYGALLGTLGLVGTAGTLLGPVLAGVIFDTTGSYTPALIMFLGTSVMAFLCFVSFRPPKPRVTPVSTT